MSTFVQSLRRLYGQGKITLEKLDSMLAEGKLTQSQYDEITS
jgi:hypothetical protein